MEVLKDNSPTTTKQRKRKQEERTSMDDLNQDVLERVLSRLPTSSFLRLAAVSKRWRSAASSATFRLACAAVPSRDPWFLMLSDHRRSLAFDSSDNKWLQLPVAAPGSDDSIPVAASGGLICRRDPLGNLSISNPITGASAGVPPPPQHPERTLGNLHAVAMVKPSNKLVLVFGEKPSLFFKLYDPEAGAWGPDVALRFDNGNIRRKKTAGEGDEEEEEEETASVYFLSRAGNVVSVTAGTQRSPWKQYSCAAAERDDGGGDEYVYYLSGAGRVTAVNLTRRWAAEYPRLLPALRECSVDVVECGGRPLVVLLSELWESAALRVWAYDDAAGEWRQAAAMPAAMSHEWYGRRADVNCAAAGRRIMVCLSSAEGFSGCVMCDLDGNVWTELPQCRLDAGAPVGFVSAFAFEPRIEASV